MEVDNEDEEMDFDGGPAEEYLSEGRDSLMIA